jgi:starch-binding outer membrane protein, SusD/RagB family
MKTNFYIKFMVAAAVAVGMISCDDYLDLKPISSNTTANAYKTGSDAEAALIGVYDSFQQEYYVWDNIIFSDVMSDNHYAGGDNPEIYAIEDLNFSPTNARFFNNWAQLYNAILKANIVLQKVPEIATTSTFSEERKQQILGEASFLRAYHYYNLVKQWGAVPLVLTTGSTDPASIFLERTPAKDVYDQIVTDLGFAVSALPDSYGGDANVNKGRATKGAANALLAKVWAQRTDRDYNKVLEHANAVINSPAGYQLLTNYAHLFDGNHYNNAESILEVQYVGGPEANWGPQLLLPPSLTGDSWRKFVTPSHDLINAFDSEGDEIRKNASVLFDEAPWSDEFWSLPVNGDVPFAFKWKSANGWASTNRQYILRLADIILLKAEALNETGQLEAAKTELNKIRSRVELDPTAANSTEAMRLAIEKERRLELVQEAQRWDDLKRYNRAVEVMNNLVEIDLRTGLPKDYNMTEGKLLLPIPQGERDRNPNLGQNEGYN